MRELNNVTIQSEESKEWKKKEGRRDLEGICWKLEGRWTKRNGFLSSQSLETHFVIRLWSQML
jgi:hypothetical protein